MLFRHMGLEVNGSLCIGAWVAKQVLGRYSREGFQSLSLPASDSVAGRDLEFIG
jgi:hypothetical protein